MGSGVFRWLPGLKGDRRSYLIGFGITISMGILVWICAMDTGKQSTGDWQKLPKMPGTLLCHAGGSVRSVGISPDGKSLVVQCYDGNLTLWQLQPALRQVGSFESPYHETRPTYRLGQTITAGTICFSPSHKYVLVDDGTSVVLVFDLPAFGMPRRLDGCYAPYPVLFSKDEKTLLGRASDGRLSQWDVQTGERITDVNCELNLHQLVAPVRVVQHSETVSIGSKQDEKVFRGAFMDISEDGRFLMTQMRPNWVYARTRQQGEWFIFIFGKWVIGATNEMSLWDTRTGQLLLRMENVSCSWFVDDDTIAVIQGVGDDHYSAAIHVSLRSAKRHGAEVASKETYFGGLLLAPSGKTFLIAGETGDPIIWTLTSERIRPLNHEEKFYGLGGHGDIRLSFTGRFVAGLARRNLEESEVVVVDSRTGAIAARLGNQSLAGRELTCLAMLLDGSTIIAGDSTGNVWAWNLDSLIRRR